MLIREGIRALRLRPLSASLGVSTGSFYHHFESFDAFLGDLCDYYSADQFRENMARGLKDAATPRDKLEQLSTLVLQQDLTRLSLAMRAWSKSDPRALKAVETLDRLLTEFLIGCFSDLGFAREQAEARAVIMLALGTTQMDISGPVRPEPALWRNILDLVCKP